MQVCLCVYSTILSDLSHQTSIWENVPEPCFSFYLAVKKLENVLNVHIHTHIYTDTDRYMSLGCVFSGVGGAKLQMFKVCSALILNHTQKSSSVEQKKKTLNDRSGR